MDFTAVGLARVKTPEFLMSLQQLPQNYVAVTFTVLAACSDEHGTVAYSDDELTDFIEVHKEQIIDIMIEAQTAIIEMQHAMSKLPA